MINKFDLLNLHGALQPINAKYTFFSKYIWTFYKNLSYPGQQGKPQQIFKDDVIHTMFSDTLELIQKSIAKRQKTLID